MFDELRDFTKIHVPEIKECYEPQAASKEDPTPFCVIAYEGELPDFGTLITGTETWNIFVYSEYYSQSLELAKKVSRQISLMEGVSYVGSIGTPFKDPALQLWQMQVSLNSPTILKEV